MGDINDLGRRVRSTTTNDRFGEVVAVSHRFGHYKIQYEDQPANSPLAQEENIDFVFV